MESRGNIFEPAFVARLFDDMVGTYGLVNVISSFGFCIRWRRQCVSQIPRWPSGAVVYDLMSGMGELWPEIVRQGGQPGSLRGIDLSAGMCDRAERQAARLGDAVRVVRADVLADTLPAGTADVVVCSFGLKTFSREQQRHLADVVLHLLKPGGRFSFVEIAVPSNRLLRVPYLLYVRHCIPLLGRLFLGNPDCYRMLSVYTEAFGNAEHFTTAARHAGLTVEHERLFFGCASLVSGEKAQGQN